MNRRALGIAILALTLTSVSCVRAPRLAHVPPSPSPPVEADGEGNRVFVAKRAAPDGELPSERYRAAADHIAAMPRYSLRDAQRAAATTDLGGWTSIGPTEIGGRTRSLIPHPTIPGVLYAGSVTGGVWKTTDSGNSWVNLTDQQPVTFIGSMAMDPSNPNVLYAGTGESYVNFRGLGILNSMDGGATWTVLPATMTSD